ncbi:hypothetical protein GDO81_027566 [Engystomops pustulosus]|uniref:Uncharacterized protein n=2 Tax=Engystomops pustulosus TaxID=76066 RepID=A0AAV6Z412_ENGPU|nr:hypothetical protein GDO81_027566 [Engystomops pustulosus]
MDSAIIIGIVIGNFAALILIIVGAYFFMKRHLEKKHQGRGAPDPGTQEKESVYQELQGQKNDIYQDLKVPTL